MSKSILVKAAAAVALRLLDILPDNHSRINLAQRSLREVAGKFYLASCGRNVNIQKQTSFSSRCTLGNNSGIGRFSKLYGPVHIGDNVMMGPYCTIYTQNHKYSDTSRPMNQQGFDEEKPVYIGNDVWIGGHVMILPGITIGNGSVIGGGSVVTRNVPDNAVVGGNPAKIIKYRH